MNNQKVSLTFTPVHIPSVHHSKADRKESQPMVPRSSDSRSVRHPETPGAKSNNGHSVSAFKDDFEPTTPGHSPGVGHIHADEDQEDNEDVDPKAPSSGSSTGHAGAAFKPTKRGHSPGVGHMSSVDQSDKIDPNSSNIEHSITTPGHSPGFGHILAGQDQDDSAKNLVLNPVSDVMVQHSNPQHQVIALALAICHLYIKVIRTIQTHPKLNILSQHQVIVLGLSLFMQMKTKTTMKMLIQRHLVLAPVLDVLVQHSNPQNQVIALALAIMSSVDQSDKTDPKHPTLNISVTTPGHSPGFGHIHADEDQDDSEDVDPKAPGSGSSTGRAGAAFKPTKPGHSPGVGHTSSVDQSDKTDPNHPTLNISVSRVPNDFQPTLPGHSTGVGHVFKAQTKNS
uniref:Uncharacterized protein n=1 Tax=Salix viminalis TaxID=40686 RepID=A0A6N2KV91_SALVM